jgi:hypothetical protein
MPTLTRPQIMGARWAWKTNEEAHVSPLPRWLIWPALALAAALFLFCHGCHGDDDNELYAAAQQQKAHPGDACVSAGGR